MVDNTSAFAVFTVDKLSSTQRRLEHGPTTEPPQNFAFTPKKAWKYGAWKPSGSS